MGLTASDSGGSSFPPVPQGLHLGVCYAVYDLGTQHQEKWNKDIHKCLIIWELPEVERIEMEKDGQQVSLPRVISKMYTLSLHSKATLRHDLESWRGMAFSEPQLKGFDIKTLLGVVCQLQVIHNKQEARTFSNVSTIVPAPEDTKITPENELAFFSFEDHAAIIPEQTPDWIRDIIKNSYEWTKEVPVDDNQPPLGDEPSDEDLIPF